MAWKKPELSKKRTRHLPKPEGGQQLTERTEQCGLKWNKGQVAERRVGKPDGPGRAEATARSLEG